MIDFCMRYSVLTENTRDALHTPVNEAKSKATTKLKSTRNKTGRGMHWMFLAMLSLLNKIIFYEPLSMFKQFSLCNLFFKKLLKD